MVWCRLTAQRAMEAAPAEVPAARSGLNPVASPASVPSTPTAAGRSLAVVAVEFSSLTTRSALRVTISTAHSVSLLREERGRPNQAGSAGTVVLRETGQSFGDLFLDENTVGSTGVLWTTMQFAGFDTVADLTDDTVTTSGHVAMIPNGLVGLEFNPNLNQDVTYRIVGNTTSTITVALNGRPALPSVTAVGATYAAVLRFDDLTMRRGAYLGMGDLLRVGGGLDITENSVLTHIDATPDYAPHLDIQAGAVTLDATSRIDVNGRGYVGGRHGHSADEGRTIGNTSGSTFRSAGSFGGLGATWGGTPNPIYGDEFNPAVLGSGGSRGY